MEKKSSTTKNFVIFVIFFCSIFCWCTASKNFIFVTHLIYSLIFFCLDSIVHFPSLLLLKRDTMNESSMNFFSFPPNFRLSSHFVLFVFYNTCLDSIQCLVVLLFYPNSFYRCLEIWYFHAGRRFCVFNVRVHVFFG